tara:strand:+ start:3402 stop:3665 length:264 start_codon:yes stop_codon:yes gene_type:complete
MNATQERLDTLSAVQALVDALGGRVKPAARIMGASESSLYKVLKKENAAPTLDTLARYANRIFRETGIRLIFTVTPDFKLHWTVKNE